jgi:predicted N-acetyltransferase YhbS
MTAIDRSAAPAEIAKGSPEPVPALLLGRLAVDHRHQRRGLGTALVAHVLATAVELNPKAACKTVVVTALSSAARTWWERLGFQPLDPADPDTTDLYLLTKDIEATLRAL